MRKLFLLIIPILFILAGCGDPPPIVGKGYLVLDKHTEPYREWTEHWTTTDCVSYDSKGRCTYYTTNYHSQTYTDDPDYIYTIRQCWHTNPPRNAFKPLTEEEKRKASDYQKCVNRNLFVPKERYGLAEIGEVIVVTNLDSVEDSDVRT